MTAPRVRFAPSPTGYLHVGGLRTALYNFLFARRAGGTLVLRIEDTDRARLVEGAVQQLIGITRWAGIEFDEGPEQGGGLGPYVQSERLAEYRKYADELINRGKAYYAFDTPEELETMRKEQERRKIPPKYDRRALRLTPAEAEEKLSRNVPYVVRMKVPESTTIRFDDIIRGGVEFSSDRLDDQVILKSDGYPTYHLANIVDDHLMNITHVIRGEEWVSSTPKHILLYEYLGWTPPRFAHLPLLLNPDKSKLSKRQGDVAVEDYRAKGYLPEALINFVALLGWNPGSERELFSLEELIGEFSLDRVGKSGAVFNVEKLDWMNTQYLRSKSDDDLLALAEPAMQKYGTQDRSYLLKAVRLVKGRMNKPSDLADSFDYFFADPQTYDEDAVRKNWKAETSGHLGVVLENLASLSGFGQKQIEEAVRRSAAALGVGAGKLIHPLRLSLSGVAVGPGLFEMMEVLGKEVCLRRIAKAQEVIGQSVMERRHG